MAKFVVYQDINGFYRWHLVAANGEKVCWGEGYSSKQGAVNSAHWVKVNAFNAPITEA